MTHDICPYAVYPFHWCKFCDESKKCKNIKTAKILYNKIYKGDKKKWASYDDARKNLENYED